MSANERTISASVIRPGDNIKWYERIVGVMSVGPSQYAKFDGMIALRFNFLPPHDTATYHVHPSDAITLVLPTEEGFENR
jgi:hypothetical protein